MRMRERGGEDGLRSSLARPHEGRGHHRTVVLRVLLAAVGVSFCSSAKTGVPTGRGLQARKVRACARSTSYRSKSEALSSVCTQSIPQGSLSADLSAFVPQLRLPSDAHTHRLRCHSGKGRWDIVKVRRRMPALPLKVHPSTNRLKMSLDSTSSSGGDDDPTGPSPGKEMGQEKEATTTVSMTSTTEVMRGSEPRSELWGNWTEHQVKMATLMWIEKFVISMKLCPFAVEAMNGLRIYVADAVNREMALDKIDVEIKWIVGLDKSSPACTLLVYPPALFEKGEMDEEENTPLCALDDDVEDGDCAGFDGFMSLAMDAREMAQGFNSAHGQDIDTETLLLTFHPNSTFSDVPEDPAEFALRSPFPTILVLRGTDVREAEDLCDIQGRVTEDIAIANEARLRTVGYDKLRAIFADIFADIQTGESERELDRIQAERQAAISDLAANEEYEYDGLDGLESAAPVRDPVGWMPAPGEQALHGGEEQGGRGAAASANGEVALSPQGDSKDEDKSKGKQLSEPFDPLGYGSGS